MLSMIFEEFTIYFSNNWASLLSWSLLVIALLSIRFYQVKWLKTKRDYLESISRVKVLSFDNLQTVKTDEIQILKDQCDALEELITTANLHLEQNSQNVDKEVLELICQIGAQTQGRTQNVK